MENQQQEPVTRNTQRFLPDLCPSTGKLGVFTMMLFVLSTCTIAAGTEDPLEPINRVTFKANSVIDSVLLKPMAKTYQSLTPRFAKSLIRNFFNNLGEVPTVVNDVLQLKIGQATKDLGRLTVNSTLGLGGLFEVAEPVLGLEKNRQDFGQTLAYWGVESGPYIVLPLLGPSTLRDSLNVAVNAVVHPLNRIDHAATQDTLRAVRVIDVRASLLPMEYLIIGDKYLYVREAYIQHRDYTINGDNMLMTFEEFQAPARSLH